MIELVDFGLEPVVTDSRFNEVPREAVEHVLTASRDGVTHTLPIKIRGETAKKT